MNNPIEQYFKYAQLAQASYGLFTAYDRDSVIAKLIISDKGDFTAKQALDFTNLTTGYALVQTQPNTSEGFSASVFKSNADGEYILSIRGTEIAPPYQDLLGADIGDIAFDGIAVSQAVDLYNYYQRLTAKAGQPLIQYHFMGNLNGPVSTIFTYTSTIATEDGALLDKHFSVVGHSLGGHLAMIMSRLAPGLVDSVYTYNAPGFDIGIIGQNNTDKLFTALKLIEIQAKGQLA